VSVVAECAAIAERGFAILPTVFSAEFVDRAVADIKRLCPHRSRAGVRHALSLGPVAEVARSPQLIELADKIGGTPVQVWEDREYWGEVNAMLYLRDRVTDDSLRCTLFSKIRHSVDLYAKDYEPRFLDIAKTSSTRKICGWQ